MPNNQETIEMRVSRNQQIQIAMFRKNHRCDMCGRFATDYHEIIHRSQTVNNEDARLASFQQEICAILCRGCHSQAEGLGASVKLLQRNIKIYGYDRVEAALAEVQSKLKGQIVLIMPKREEIHG